MIKRYTKKDEKVNVIIRKKQTKVDLAKYKYACYMYLIISTFANAIVKNNFITWSGLTANLILKYLPKSIYTYQGHLHFKKQGLQSTKQGRNKIRVSEE